MKIISIQFVYFFNGIMDRPDQKATVINTRLNNLFDGYPTILPFADGMPVDLPFVQLKSNNGKYNLNMSKSRCDFIINFPLAENIENGIESFKLTVRNLTIELSNMKFSRVAIVGRFCIEEKKAVPFICEKYLKKDLSSAIELRIRYNNRRQWLNTKINDIIDIFNMKYTINNKTGEGIEIQRDINTVPELVLSVSKKEVDKFLEDNISSFFENSILEVVK